MSEISGKALVKCIDEGCGYEEYTDVIKCVFEDHEDFEYQDICPKCNGDLICIKSTFNPLN